MKIIGPSGAESKECKLPLARLFDTANAKILDFFLSNDGLEYTYNEISKLTAIPRRTLQKSLKILLNEKMIKRTRKNERTFYYTINHASQRVRGLHEYVESTMMSNLDEASK